MSFLFMTTKTFLMATLLVLALAYPSITMASTNPSCPSSCGDLVIPYPFGIGKGCFRDGYEIACNKHDVGDPSNGKYVATLAGTNVTVHKLSLDPAEVQVQLPIGWQCYNKTGGIEENSQARVDFNPKSVFRISDARNVLVVIGCNACAWLQSKNETRGPYAYHYYTGCLSYCSDLNNIPDGSCSGVGCCQVSIPFGLTDNAVAFYDFGHGPFVSFSRCDYAFLVDKDSFKFGKSSLTMSTDTIMPLWLNWALREKNNCVQAQASPESYGCRSSNSECSESVNEPGYHCKCSTGYQGNPYVLNGCVDINECELPDEYPCHGICHNKVGSYDCTCESGKYGNPFNNSCRDKFPRGERLALGISVSIVGLLILALSVIIVFQKKRLQKEREIFFKKNGGLILYEQLMSRKVETMRIFTEAGLVKITNNFDTVIGRGGQGKVYKGLLDGSREVAVKKCILVDDEKMKEEFMNEMIILSQINHKNVVRLLGCCLERDVPMLVYEYVPKGTLDNFLHGNQLYISLETRLRICTESAKALAHLHSETIQPILHGDVKSANILLDNNCMAKVSDFGTSRLLSMDETQFATYVKGTMGYLDPEFLQNQRLTEKSDVYSFGVVILELITRKKAVYFDGNYERRLLYQAFLSEMKENTIEQMLDLQIANEDNLPLLFKVSELAEKCLRPSGEERPTMTEVAEQLKGFWRSSYTSDSTW